MFLIARRRRKIWWIWMGFHSKMRRNPGNLLLSLTHTPPGGGGGSRKTRDYDLWSGKISGLLLIVLWLIITTRGCKIYGKKKHPPTRLAKKLPRVSRFQILFYLKKKIWKNNIFCSQALAFRKTNFLYFLVFWKFENGKPMPRSFLTFTKKCVKSVFFLFFPCFIIHILRQFL